MSISPHPSEHLLQDRVRWQLKFDAPVEMIDPRLPCKQWRNADTGVESVIHHRTIGFQYINTVIESGLIKREITFSGIFEPIVVPKRTVDAACGCT